MPVSMRWVGSPEFEPIHHHEGDAGFDLVVSERVTIPPGEFADVPMGIRIEMPPHLWALLTGRSSTLKKRKLMVMQGVIDNGYRGDVFAGVWNLGKEAHTIAPMSRIAQLIPFHLEAPRVSLLRSLELSNSDRGVGAFGSTGE